MTTGIADKLNLGRLYLVSGSPVADGSSAGNATIYFGPFLGNIITLYNGAIEVTQTFSEASLSVSALSTGMYDVYVTSASPTTVTLSTVAWGGLNTPPTRSVQGGRYVKSGTPTALLAGSIYVSNPSTGVTADWTGQRWNSNLYNTVQKTLSAQIATASWNYSTPTWRAADANTTDGQGRVSVVQVGLTNTGLIDATYCQSVSMTGSASNPSNAFSIAVDSVTTPSSFAAGIASADNAGTIAAFIASAVVRYPTQVTGGYHYIQMLEISPGGAAGATIYGNNADLASGLTGTGFF